MNTLVREEAGSNAQPDSAGEQDGIPFGRSHLALVPPSQSPLTGLLDKHRKDVKGAKQPVEKPREDRFSGPMPRNLGPFLTKVLGGAEGATPEVPAVPASTANRRDDEERPPLESVAAYTMTAGNDILFTSPGFRASISVPQGTREEDPEGWDLVDRAAIKAVADLVRGYRDRRRLIATFSTEGAVDPVVMESNIARARAVEMQLLNVQFLKDLLPDAMQRSATKVEDGLREIIADLLGE